LFQCNPQGKTPIHLLMKKSHVSIDVLNYLIQSNRDNIHIHQEDNEMTTTTTTTTTKNVKSTSTSTIAATKNIKSKSTISLCDNEPLLEKKHVIQLNLLKEIISTGNIDAGRILIRYCPDILNVKIYKKLPIHLVASYDTFTNRDDNNNNGDPDDINDRIENHNLGFLDANNNGSNNNNSSNNRNGTGSHDEQQQQQHQHQGIKNVVLKYEDQPALFQLLLQEGIRIENESNNINNDNDTNRRHHGLGGLLIKDKKVGCCALDSIIYRIDRLYANDSIDIIIFDHLQQTLIRQRLRQRLSRQSREMKDSRLALCWKFIDICV